MALEPDPDCDKSLYLPDKISRQAGCTAAPPQRPAAVHLISQHKSAEIAEIACHSMPVSHLQLPPAALKVLLIAASNAGLSSEGIASARQAHHWSGTKIVLQDQSYSLPFLLIHHDAHVRKHHCRRADESAVTLNCNPKS